MHVHVRWNFAHCFYIKDVFSFVQNNVIVLTKFAYENLWSINVDISSLNSFKKKQILKVNFYSVYDKNISTYPFVCLWNSMFLYYSAIHMHDSWWKKTQFRLCWKLYTLHILLISKVKLRHLIFRKPIADILFSKRVTI